MATVWDLTDLLSSPAAWMILTGGATGFAVLWQGRQGIDHAKRARHHAEDVEWLNSPLPGINAAAVAYLPFKAGVSPPLGPRPSGPVRCASCGATGRGGQDCDHCGNLLPYPPSPKDAAGHTVRAGVLTPDEARRIERNAAALGMGNVVTMHRDGTITRTPSARPRESTVVYGFPRKAQATGKPPPPRTLPIVKPEHIRPLVSPEAWERFADELARNGVAEITIETAGRAGDLNLAPGEIVRIEDGPQSRSPGRGGRIAK